MEIYKPFVTLTTTTPEHVIPDQINFKKRIKKTAAYYPILVCEAKDTGYCVEHNLSQHSHGLIESKPILPLHNQRLQLFQCNFFRHEKKNFIGLDTTT